MLRLRVVAVPSGARVEVDVRRAGDDAAGTRSPRGLRLRSSDL